MAQLLSLTSAAPGWTALPPSVQSTLLAPHFFASVVAPGFGSSISTAFVVAGSLLAAAAVISAFRGQPYIYQEHLVAKGPATGPDPSANAPGAGAPAGIGPGGGAPQLGPHR